MSSRRELFYYEDYPDDDEGEEENLTPIVRASSQLAAKQQQEIVPNYVPVTLRGPSYRYRILPACPTSIHVDQPPLLLPNVPSRSKHFPISSTSIGILIIN